MFSYYSVVIHGMGFLDDRWYRAYFWCELCKGWQNLRRRKGGCRFGEEQKTLDNILDNIATKLGTKCTRREALWYLVENTDPSLLESQGHSGASGVYACIYYVCVSK